MPPIIRKKTVDPTLPPPIVEEPKPDVRLAYNPGPCTAYRGIGGGPEEVLKAEAEAKPDVRLAYWAHQGPRPAFDKQPATEAPSVRLAHDPGAQGDNVLRSDGPYPMADDSLPALLVSYYYLPQFQENRCRYNFRDWVMDSGAFSAHNSGKTIDLKEYIDKCLELMATDPSLTEIYSLDVIGDWKASLKNTEQMWAENIPAIPCFHANEPWDALIGMARDYPKIALGGVALAKAGKKMAWAGQCFARVWKAVGPKKTHGFAFCSEQAVLGLPFHSVDATSWEVGPCRYGMWRAFGGQRVSVRGSKQNLRAEVEWYLDLEKRARVKWKKEMLLMEQLSPTKQLFQGPTVRLAFAGVGSNTYLKDGGAVCRGLEGKPDVRLVAANDAGLGGARVIARALGEDAEDPGQELIRVPAPTVRLAEGGEGGRIEAKSAALRK